MKRREKLYKVLAAGHESCNGGRATWTPRKWMPEIAGALVACVNGYHLCRRGDLVEWLNVEIWEAEYRGDRIDAEEKIVVREAQITHRVSTWTERTARLFACDCAEGALKKHWTDKRDTRPAEAIRVARLYANGKATRAELRAAGAAAWAAAVAAWAAAGAAREAAREAARAAAWEAEHRWQTKRLFEYLEGKRRGGQHGLRSSGKGACGLPGNLPRSEGRSQEDSRGAL